MKLPLFVREHALVNKSMVERVYCPIIKDGCSTVTTAESFFVHAAFTIFLTCIKHYRVAPHQRETEARSKSFPCIASKKVAGYTLLIVVFEEIQHVALYVVDRLPRCRHGCGGGFWSAHYVPHAVVHTHLVIKVVKSCANIHTI